MNMRDKEFTSRTGGGPGGAADAGERNFAPGTVSTHAKPSPGPAAGASRPHESARAHVAGTATYVDDIPEVKGTLHAAPILSTVAHGRLLGVDTRAALAMPGVRGVVLAQDIPGDPKLATFVHDEPIFALDKVEHIGQVVGVVVADTVMQARRAARKVQLDIEPLKAVLSPREAHALQSYVLPPVTVRRGEPEAALARSAHRLDGQLEVGGQEHFYLEGQVAYALPLEQDQWWIYSSTQHPGEIQHWVAHALGLENNAVTVECRRMGGGFGGKETQAGHLAVWAALAARKCKHPVKLRLDRDDDFMITGKRHPFAYDYSVGFDDTGLVTALKLTMLANCGFSADLSGPVADRAIFHTDNAYFLSDVEIASYRCKTMLDPLPLPGHRIDMAVRDTGEHPPVIQHHQRQTDAGRSRNLERGIHVAQQERIESLGQAVLVVDDAAAAVAQHEPPRHREAELRHGREVGGHGVTTGGDAEVRPPDVGAEIETVENGGAVRRPRVVAPVPEERRRHGCCMVCRYLSSSAASAPLYDATCRRSLARVRGRQHLPAAHQLVVCDHAGDDGLLHRSGRRTSVASRIGMASV